MDANDSNPGTITTPLRTIQTALECAVPGQDIRVANGTYQANMDNRVILTEGKSIYGGYSSDYQVRDPAVYPTIITDVTDLSMGIMSGVTPVLIDGNTTPATVLDGFTINGLTTGAGESVGAIIINDSGSPTISNNIINGGGSNLIDGSGGIQLYNSGAVIINNTINGGTPRDFSYGIMGNLDGADISNNTIDVGDGIAPTGGDAIHAECMAGACIIRNNSISARNSGILSRTGDMASIIIEGNTVASGPSEYNTGIGGGGEYGESVIRNNIIVIEGGMGTTGIDVRGKTVISNNTVVFRGSVPPTPLIVGIDFGGKFSSVIQNNIIELVAANTTICAYGSSTTISLKNNDLTGCITLYSEDGTGEINNIDDLNALSNIDASGNVSIQPNLDAAQDFRLTESSPVAVTQGGLDLSSDFNTDKAGNLRTAPWSMGAYEYD
jgi:hypothetical protein